MDQKEAVFLGGLNDTSADGGWPLVDAGTFEDRSVRFYPLLSAAILRRFFLSLHPTVSFIIPLLFTRCPAQQPSRPPTLVGFPPPRRA